MPNGPVFAGIGYAQPGSKTPLSQGGGEGRPQWLCFGTQFRPPREGTLGQQSHHEVFTVVGRELRFPIVRR